MTKGSFIVVYGLDGVGKSTIVDILSKKLDGSVINFDKYKDKISNPYLLSKKEVLKTDIEPVKFFHYLGSNIFQGGVISKLIKKGNIVVKSRWFIDIFADFSFKKIKISEEIKDIIPFLEPNISILLTANENERLKRIKKREEEPTWQDLNIKRSRYISNYLDKYFSKKIFNKKNFVRINTNNKSPEKISNEIISFIKNGKQNSF